MFGFISANISDLSDEEKARYHALYCGLCRQLKESFGLKGQALLSYDLTFLEMMLNSLYEPREEGATQRCPVHPTEVKDCTASRFADYAADMTIALAYHKCLDDWQDEQKLSAQAAALLLEKSYREVMERWPRQAQAIEAGMELVRADEERNALAIAEAANRSIHASTESGNMGRIEGSATPPATDVSETIPSGGSDEGDNPLADENDEVLPAPSPDAAAIHFGMLLGEVFAMEDDIWADTLRRFGARLGRFIYFMDAAVDLQEDLGKNRYNPFVSLDLDIESMRELLEGLLGAACEAFDLLPLEQDLHIMQSVLYAGAWQQFNKAYPSREPSDGTASVNEETAAASASSSVLSAS